MPTALITGITGQDGAYLARFLIDKGYRVVGTVHPAAPHHFGSLEAFHIKAHIQFIATDFADQDAVTQALEVAQPDEIYHLAALTSVAESWQRPVETGEITGLGAARLLQAWHQTRPQARLFQASSAEIFGQVCETPQTEATPFRPQSPYGAAKLYAHIMTGTYRVAHRLHASCGILFNHESPLRPEHFVTRKVTLAAARIKYGLQSELVLGNLDVQRDWGFAGDYVEAMWRIVQHDSPDDYIIATGQVHSLREFVDAAFQHLDLDYRHYVRVDPAFFRPVELLALVGSPAKLSGTLGWTPRVSFGQMVQLLVAADVQRVLHQEAAIAYL